MTRGGITEAPSQEELIEAEAKLLEIMEWVPDLTVEGFESPQRLGEACLRSRFGFNNEVRHIVKQFILAKRYIALHPRARSRAVGWDSYGLKHRAERFYTTIGLDSSDREWHPYICNGAFIAAAYALWVPVWRDKEGLNAKIGILPYKGYLDDPDIVRG